MRADRALVGVFLAFSLFCASLLGWPDVELRRPFLRPLNLVGVPLGRAFFRKAQFQRAPVVNAACATSVRWDEPERTRKRLRTPRPARPRDNGKETDLRAGVSEWSHLLPPEAHSLHVCRPRCCEPNEDAQASLTCRIFEPRTSPEK